MVDSLAARGRSHTHLRELLDARDPILHASERERLLDAADALLFDEPDGEAKLADARNMLGEMVESGRWVQGPADEVAIALEGCRNRVLGASA
jgi:hypothetical protein